MLGVSAGRGRGAARGRTLGGGGTVEENSGGFERAVETAEGDSEAGAWGGGVRRRSEKGRGSRAPVRMSTFTLSEVAPWFGGGSGVSAVVGCRVRGVPGEAWRPWATLRAPRQPLLPKTQRVGSFENSLDSSGFHPALLESQGWSGVGESTFLRRFPL